MTIHHNITTPKHQLNSLWKRDRHLVQ